MSEAGIDLDNDLPRYNSWGATELQSPHIQLPKDEEYHPGIYPLVQADTLTVDIKAKEDSTHVFIDDIITITIDNLSWVKRTKNAALLVLHTIFRVLNPSEPLKLDVPL